MDRLEEALVPFTQYVVSFPRMYEDADETPQAYPSLWVLVGSPAMHAALVVRIY